MHKDLAANDTVDENSFSHESGKKVFIRKGHTYNYITV